MNVIQVSHRYRPSIGGIENYCYRLTESIRKSGYSTSVITTDVSLANGQSPMAAERDATYCRTTATVFRNPCSIELYRELQESDAALYHLHSPWYLSTLEAVLALPEETPMVMTVHGFQPIQTISAQILSTLYKPLAQYILDRVDRTIVLGESEKQRLVDKYSVVPDEVEVIPNGIHPDAHDISTEVVERIQTKYKIDPTTPTILFVSRMVPLKNPRLVVDAITEHLRNISLDILIVGNGNKSYIENLKYRADERFKFLSNLPFEDLQAIYHISDVFVLPSQAEGLPTVVLEAMNARLPIVTTPVGALGDVITHGENGWLMESPSSEDGLAKAIKHYLDHPSDRQETGQRNRAYVRKEFAWEDIAHQIQEVYEDILQRPAGRPHRGDRH